MEEMKGETEGEREEWLCAERRGRVPRCTWDPDFFVASLSLFFFCFFNLLVWLISSSSNLPKAIYANLFFSLTVTFRMV